MPAVTIEVPPPPPMPMMRGDVVAGRDEGGEGLAHAGDGGAAVVAAEHCRRAVRMVRGDFGGGDVDARRAAARADVDGAAARRPPSRTRAARKASSSPLVSAVPTT